MSTVVIILRKNESNSDGTYLLAVRIKKNRKRSIML